MRCPQVVLSLESASYSPARNAMYPASDDAGFPLMEILDEITVYT
jgi:hypothetical protein